MKTQLFVVVIASVVMCGLAPADEGRIPIYQPTTITQPGHYVLTRDVLHAEDSDAPAPIVIQAGSVILDLNGHAIRGRGNAFYDIGLISISTAVGPVTIENGFLSGTVGAIGGSTPKLILRNLTIENIRSRAVVVTTNYLEVSSCFISGETSSIVLSSPTTGIISGNHLEGGDTAVSLGSFHDGTFQGNNVSAQGGGPTCASFGSTNIIDSNTFSDCNTGFFVAGGSHITRNVVIGQGVGIYLNGPTSVVESNTIQGGIAGISVQSDNNFIRNNKIIDSLDQIRISGSGNILDSNAIEGGACGINFMSGTGNAYRNNFLRNHSTGSVCGSTTGQTDAGGNLY